MGCVFLSFSPRKVSSHENTALENEGAKNSKDLSVIRQVIAVKHIYRISDEALHELHMIGAVIPSKTVINTEKNRLNTTLEIMSHPSVSSITAFEIFNEHFYCVIFITIFLK